jgi:hypothetical protein
MEINGQFHAPAALPPEERTHWYRCIRRWVGPRVCLDAVAAAVIHPVAEALH